MATKDHGPSVKDDKQYEALRAKGESKEKAARIANTPARVAGKRGGRAEPYEEWTVEELRKKASKVGVEGRSGMKKNELIDALRNH